jgi:DNA-directed RNA polymerase subunit RPC12/RpoP
MNIDLSGHKIEIECPNCGRPVKFNLGQVGAAIACPGCRVLIELVGEDSGSIEGRIKEKAGTARK